MSVAFPGESAEYRAARDRLLAHDVGPRRAIEAVAAARRDLPPGGVVPDDYVFGDEGDPVDVGFSELFAPGKLSLVIYRMMFPRDPGDDRPGPRSGVTARLRLHDGPCPPARRCSISSMCRGARERAPQLRRGRESSGGADPHLRRGARLAAAATPVVGRQHLQPRLPRRVDRRTPGADA